MPDCNLPSVDQTNRLPAPVASTLNPSTRRTTIKKTTRLSNAQPLVGEEGSRAAEIYSAPRPPANGRIIGLDCHPDTYTAAVFRGSTPHDARKLCTRENLSLQRLMEWAGSEFTRHDLFLMEAGSNSFEIHRRLLALGLRAVVLESCYVGKHAKTYADNDKMAAARIALVYLAGNAPCVWVPDPLSCERRELLHSHQNAVAGHTAALNSLKSYLNGFAIRPGSRGLQLERTRAWLYKERDWSPLQRESAPPANPGRPGRATDGQRHAAGSMGLEALRPQRSAPHCRGRRCTQTGGASLASFERQPASRLGSQQKPIPQAPKARRHPGQEPQSQTGPARRSQALHPRTSKKNPLRCHQSRTGLMGAARPQTPRRSPRQAFGGNLRRGLPAASAETKIYEEKT